MQVINIRSINGEPHKIQLIYAILFFLFLIPVFIIKDNVNSFIGVLLAKIGFLIMFGGLGVLNLIGGIKAYRLPKENRKLHPVHHKHKK